MKTFLLSLLTLSYLAGLSKSVFATTEPSILSYALATDIDSLDPDRAYDATSIFVVQQMYESLVEFQDSSLDRFAPRIASVVPSIDNGFLSKDGLTYAFPLRRGVKFHDGREMSAEDVKYSLMRFMLNTGDDGPAALLLLPLTGHRTAGTIDGKPDFEVYDLVDKAVSVEGGAVVIRLPKPFAPLLSVLAGSAQILSKSYMIAHGGWDGTKKDWPSHWRVRKDKTVLYERENGTGPFKLGRWDKEAKTLTLLRHDTYWRAPASLSIVNVITVEDPKTRRIMLERGDIDVAQVNTRALPYFQAVPNAQVQSGLQQLQVDDVILFNQKIESRDNPWIGSGRLDGQGIPPDFFSDVEIRKGFAYAFDIQGFIQEAFRGSATRARGPIPVSLLMNGRLPPPQVRPYSLKDATTAFQVAQAGQVWEKGFFLPMAYPEGDSERKMTCRYLQSALVKINEKFRIECRSIAQSKLLEELNARRLSAFVYRWILDYPDAHNAVEPFLGSRGFFAASLGYSNPRADKLIEKALSETDPAIRRSLYIELEALAAYDVPAIFTVETTGAIARTNKVPNWIHHPMQPYGNLYEVTKLP